MTIPRSVNNEIFIGDYFKLRIQVLQLVTLEWCIGQKSVPYTVSLVVRRTTEVKHIVGPNPAMDAVLKRAVVNPVIGMVLFIRCEKPT